MLYFVRHFGVSGGGGVGLAAEGAGGLLLELDVEGVEDGEGAGGGSEEVAGGDEDLAPGVEARSEGGEAVAEAAGPLPDLGGLRDALAAELLGEVEDAAEGLLVLAELAQDGLRVPAEGLVGGLAGAQVLPHATLRTPDPLLHQSQLRPQLARLHPRLQRVPPVLPRHLHSPPALAQPDDHLRIPLSSFPFQLGSG